MENTIQYLPDMVFLTTLLAHKGWYGGYKQKYTHGLENGNLK